MKRSILCLLLLIAISATVKPARIFDFESAHRRALGGAVVLSDPNPTDQLLIPLPNAERPVQLQTEMLRQFDLPEFDTYVLAGSFQWSSLIMAAGYSQFGQDQLYTEKTIRGMVGLTYDSLTAGISVSNCRLDFGGGYGRLSAASVGLGASFRRGKYFVGLALDNLNRPGFTDSAPTIGRCWSLLAEFKGAAGFELVGKLTYEKTAGTRIALGQQIALSSKARILWGLHNAPFEYGGALQLTANGFELTLVTSYHPDLGFTTAGGLAAGLGSYRKDQ